MCSIFLISIFIEVNLFWVGNNIYRGIVLDVFFFLSHDKCIISILINKPCTIYLCYVNDYTSPVNMFSMFYLCQFTYITKVITKLNKCIQN